MTTEEVFCLFVIDEDDPEYKHLLGIYYRRDSCMRRVKQMNLKKGRYIIESWDLE